MTSGVAVHVPERYTRVFSYRYHRAAFMNPLSSAMFCLFSSSSVCVWRGGGGARERVRMHPCAVQLITLVSYFVKNGPVCTVLGVGAQFFGIRRDD